MTQFHLQEKIVINNVHIKMKMRRGYVNVIKCLEFSQKTEKYSVQKETDKWYLGIFCLKVSRKKMNGRNYGVNHIGSRI